MTTSRRPVVVLRGHRDRVRSVAICANGNTIFSGSEDETIRVWDAHSHECKGVLEGHEGMATSLALSPNGETLYSASYRGMDERGASNGVICVWDVQSMRLIKTLKDSRNQDVCSLALSSDGTRLFSGGFRAVAMWDTRSFECLQELRKHSGIITSLAFAMGAKKLFSASSDKSMGVWQTNPFQFIAALQHESYVHCAAVSPDGAFVYSGCNDGSIYVWDAQSHKSKGKIEERSRCRVASLTLSPNGTTLFSSSDDTICIWDTQSRRSLGVLRGGHRYIVSSVLMSADGISIISGSWDNTVCIWNMSVGRITSSFQAYDEPSAVSSLALSSDDKYLFSSAGAVSFQWRVTSGEIIKEFHGHSDSVNSLALSPSGKLLASASQDKSVIVWTIETAECIAALPQDTAVRDVVFYRKYRNLASDEDKDGTIIVANSSGLIRVLNVASQACIAELQGHQGGVLSLALSSRNSKLFTSSSGDTTIRAWGMEEGYQVVGILEGHSSTISCLALSPSEDIVVTGSHDETIRLWETDTLSHIFTLEGTCRPISSLALTVDNGNRERICVFAGDNTGSVFFWDVRIKEHRNDVLPSHHTVLNSQQGTVEAMVLSSDGDILYSAHASGTIVDLLLSSVTSRDGRRCNVLYSLPLSPLTINDMVLYDLDDAEKNPAYDWPQFKAISDDVLKYALSSDFGDDLLKISPEEKQNLKMADKATHANPLHLTVSKGDVAAPLLQMMLDIAPWEAFRTRQGPLLEHWTSEQPPKKCSLLLRASRGSHTKCIDVIIKAFMQLIRDHPEVLQYAFPTIIDEVDVWNANLDFSALQGLLMTPVDGDPTETAGFWRQLVLMDRTGDLVSWCANQMPSLASDGLVTAFHQEKSKRLPRMLSLVFSALREINKHETEKRLLQVYDRTAGVGGTTTWHQMVASEELDEVVFKIAQALPNMHKQKDPHERSAHALAAPRCKQKINQAVLFCGEFKLGKELHRSRTSTVLTAEQIIVHLPSSSSSNPKETAEEVAVVIKLMLHEDMYRREVDEREGLNKGHIIPILSKSEDYDSWDEQVTRLQIRGGPYPYGIVMPAASRNLMTALIQEDPTYDEACIMQLQLAQALHHLHTHGRLHGDFKPLNVVRMENNSWRLIDFDATVNMGSPAGAKTSAAYCPPEMTTAVEHDKGDKVKVITSTEAFQLIQSSSETTEEANEIVLRRYVGSGASETPYTRVDERYAAFCNGSYDLIGAEPSFDLWSYGAVLYQTLARKALFESDASDNLTSALELRRLHRWAHYDVEMAMDEVESVLTFDFGQRDVVKRVAAAELVGWLLQPEPRLRPTSFDAVINHAFFHGIGQNEKEADWKMSSLHFAAAVGDMTAVRENLEADNDGINATNHVLGKTPLHLAAEHGHAEIVETLLQCQRCDVGVRDKAGNAMVHSVIGKAEQAAGRRDHGSMSELLDVLMLVMNVNRSAFEEQNKDGVTGFDLGRNSKVKKIRELFRGRQTILSAIRNHHDFETADFNALWLLDEHQPALEKAIFKVLEEWAFDVEDEKSIESKRLYLCRNIFPLKMWAAVSPFERLKEIAQGRMLEILQVLYSIRDEMTRNEGGKEILEVESFGHVRVEVIGSDECAAAGRSSKQMKKAVDENVLVPFLAAAADELREEFRHHLMRALGKGVVFFDEKRHAKNISTSHPDWERWCVVAPVKETSRMKEKVKEYAGGGEGDWPFSSKIGDVLRAMVVCRGGPTAGKTILHTWYQLQEAFDISDGHGRLKNNFAIAGRKDKDGQHKDQKPPDMLINAVLEIKDAMSMVVEIQVHHEEILNLKESKVHLLHEITRAASIEALRTKSQTHDGHDDDDERDVQLKETTEQLEHHAEQLKHMTEQLEHQAEQLKEKTAQLEDKKEQLKEHAEQLKEKEKRVEKLKSILARYRH